MDAIELSCVDALSFVAIEAATSLARADLFFGLLLGLLC